MRSSFMFTIPKIGKHRITAAVCIPVLQIIVKNGFCDGVMTVLLLFQPFTRGCSGVVVVYSAAKWS